MNILATKSARFDHLIGLARNLENARYAKPREQQKALKLAAIYRDMAFWTMPSEAAVAELNLTERARLAVKLRQMTVANGCTESEADNAAQLLLKLEGGG